MLNISAVVKEEPKSVLDQLMYFFHLELPIVKYFTKIC